MWVGSGSGCVVGASFAAWLRTSGATWCGCSLTLPARSSGTGGGPVDYEDACLPAGLVADLEAWEASYCDGLDDELEWRSRDLEKAHAALGAELARRVAEALGSRFVIQGDGGKVRSGGPPTSPDAAAAFTALADDEEAEYNPRARMVADGAEISWSAYPPGPPEGKD